MAKTTRFVYDLPLTEEQAPRPGDYMTSVRCAYEIVDAVPVESRVWPNRWKLTLRRLPSGCNDDPPIPQLDHVTWPSERYRRGESPAEFFGVTVDEPGE